jgi:hypothetical protein
VIILRRCFLGLEQYGQKYIEIIFSNPNYCLGHQDTGLLSVNRNSLENMQFLAIQAYRGFLTVPMHKNVKLYHLFTIRTSVIRSLPINRNSQNMQFLAIQAYCGFLTIPMHKNVKLYHLFTIRTSVIRSLPINT